MDGVIVILGLLVLAIPVSIIALWVSLSRLRARVMQLEADLRDVHRGEVRAGQALAQSAAVIVGRPAQESQPDPQERPEVAQAIPVEAQVEGSVLPGNRAVPLPAAVADPVEQDRALVMRSDRFANLMAWLLRNWVYVISAVSLALAGVFFVQYGMEKGLLPPGLRVLAAIAFGAALIGAGEWLRRRHGDEGDQATANLPSVFSGAGLVAIFAGIVAARQLYGLIGPELAFGGLLTTALLAVVLGWLHGPLLAAIGLLGAAATPFLVAGGAGPAPWLYGYYALIAAMGLAVDALRRWAWVSVLALVLGFGGAYLMFAGGAGVAGFALALVALAVLSVALPVMQVMPTHEGPSVVEALLLHGKEGWPDFPVRLAAGSVLTASVGLLSVFSWQPDEMLLVYGLIVVLALALLLWAEKAPGIGDLAALPALALVGRLANDALNHNPLSREFSALAIEMRAPESSAPMTVTILFAMAVVMSLAFAWRALRSQGLQGIAFGLGAVLTAPVAAAGLELFWNPSPVLGAYPWALHVIALAGLMVALALRFAKVDAADLRRAAHATLSALSLIALALFLITSSSALTLALAVLVLAAAVLDRRFVLPEMGLFIQAGVAVLGYRLLVDPGIEWALWANLGAVLITYLGVIGALIAAIYLLRPVERPIAMGVMESAAAGFAAVLLNILITRWMMPADHSYPDGTAAFATLSALPWLVLMLMQIYRARLGGVLRWLRGVIALIAGLIAAGGLAMAVTLLNPMFSWGPQDLSGRVSGPMVFDSLMVAYLVPGLLLLAAAWKLPGVPRLLRMAFAAVGGVLSALYVVLEIRRFWQGDWLGGSSVVQGELYSYTVAMMLLGAGLLYQAIARHCDMLRKIAMAVIALTVAKVFLWDASGLTGLTRVVSFLGLGLSLAALAWLNRWAGQVAGKPPAES